MFYAIFTDVSADLSGQWALEHQLSFIPMSYSLGEEMRVCARPEEADILKKFYDGQRSGDLTRTSQITPAQYQEAFHETLEKGQDILYLSLSGGLSSTYESACMAAKKLMDKYPGTTIECVDTLAATGGMDILSERAVRNRDIGMTVKENAENLRAATHRIRHWFLVQDLKYLQRGGRVGAVAATFGTIMQMRPILKIDETGKLVTIGKERGNRFAVRDLLKHFSETHDEAAEDPIYVINADAPELAEMLEHGIREIYPDAVIRHAILSPIIGAHTGPGMAAICHMGK
ncbi:MAG: DegV family protein [Clostridia bacterium]|nr:DegV family protein [Clostridia bacterium]